MARGQLNRQQFRHATKTAGKPALQPVISVPEVNFLLPVSTEVKFLLPVSTEVFYLLPVSTEVFFMFTQNRTLGN